MKKTDIGRIGLGVPKANLNAQFVLSREIEKERVRRAYGKILFAVSLLTEGGGMER